MKDLKFVFLMASERSGSNLIATFLDANPNICAPPPVHLIRAMLQHRHKYGDFIIKKSWKAFVQDCKDLIDTSQTGTWTLWDPNDIMKANSNERSLANIVKDVYKQQASIDSNEIIFIKENETHMLCPFIEKAFPEAKYVWLVRDPRDMAASHVASPGRSGGVAEAARRWFVEQKGTRIALNAITDLEPHRLTYHLVRYEDLVQYPEQTAKKLCDFIEVPYDETMTYYYSLNPWPS